jgi:hypothetical protein
VHDKKDEEMNKMKNSTKVRRIDKDEHNATIALKMTGKI